MICTTSPQHLWFFVGSQFGRFSQRYDTFMYFGCYIMLYIPILGWLCNILYLTLSFLSTFSEPHWPIKPCKWWFMHRKHIAHGLFNSSQVVPTREIESLAVVHSCRQLWNSPFLMCESRGQLPLENISAVDSCCFSADFYLPDSLGSNRILRYLTIVFSSQSRSRCNFAGYIHLLLQDRVPS